MSVLDDLRQRIEAVGKQSQLGLENPLNQPAHRTKADHRRAHKWQALLVFVFARRFANKYDVGVDIAVTHHQISGLRR